MNAPPVRNTLGNSLSRSTSVEDHFWCEKSSGRRDLIASCGGLIADPVLCALFCTALLYAVLLWMTLSFTAPLSPYSSVLHCSVRQLQKFIILNWSGQTLSKVVPHGPKIVQNNLKWSKIVKIIQNYPTSSQKVEKGLK